MVLLLKGDNDGVGGDSNDFFILAAPGSPEVFLVSCSRDHAMLGSKLGVPTC